MVELFNVTASYQKGTDVLKDVTLRINDGDFAFIVGSSGAGKSTLIKLLLKEIDADNGSIIVNDFNLTRLRPRQVPKFRRTIGVVFQDFRLIPNMTIYDNVAFVLRVTNKSNKYIKQRVPYVLNLVNLMDKMKSYPTELSGGEQQMSAIAKILLLDTNIIVFDEPTHCLDVNRKDIFKSIIKELSARGRTIVIISHDVDFTFEVADRLIVMFQGEIVSDGSPREILSNNRYFTTSIGRILGRQNKGYLIPNDFNGKVY